jgi:rubrerythrin
MGGVRQGAFSRLKWVRPRERRAGRPRGLSPTREAAADTGTSGALREAVLAIGLPEPPTPRPPVAEARYFLQAAAEVEHALLVQYLYAAYSINPRGSAAARTRQRKLLDIAREEMGHLITVQNLLLAIGGVHYLDRENVSYGETSAGAYPFPIRFEPLSKDSLAKYVTTESPPLELLPDAALREELTLIFQRAKAVAGSRINHVGLLFMKLFWLFQPGDDPHPLWPELPTDLMPAGRHIPVDDFAPASEPRQAMAAEFGQDAVDPELPDTTENIYVLPVRSRIEALFAIDKVAEQGEGVKLARNSHFERFLDTYRGFDGELAGRVLNVPVNPNTGGRKQSDPAADQARITHPAALRWARLLNARYQILLMELTLALHQPRQPDDGSPLGRSALIAASINPEMTVAIKRIAGRLTELPRKEGGSAGDRAAAPFELPAARLPTDSQAVKGRLKELISGSGALMAELKALTGESAPTDADLAFLGELGALDAPLAGALSAT